MATGSDPGAGGTAAKPVRVVVVDDHVYVRDGLTMALEDDPRIRVVGKFATAEEALNDLEKLDADVAIFDYRLPGISGAEACALVRQHELRTRTIILTSFEKDKLALTSYEAGASAFVVKGSDPSFLIEAVHAVAAGQTYIDPNLGGRLVELATQGQRHIGPFGLSVMELRVLQRLPEQLTGREIGSQLGISEETVRTHIKNACAKLGVKGGKQALIEAARKKGLL